MAICAHLACYTAAGVSLGPFNLAWSSSSTESVRKSQMKSGKAKVGTDTGHGGRFRAVQGFRYYGQKGFGT